MNRTGAESSRAMGDDVARASWGQTLLTGCVLAGCLAIIAALIVF